MIGRWRWCEARAVSLPVAVAVLASLWSAPGWGDPRTRLINVDTARTIEGGQWQYGADVRAFGGADDQSYVSGRIACVRGDYQLEVLGSFAPRAMHDTGFTTLEYAGTTWEVRAKRRLMRRGSGLLSAIGAVELPNTPAQDEAHFALHLPLTIDRGSATSGHIVPKFVFLDGNVISAIGLAVEHEIDRELTVMLEFTPIIDGANTRDRRGALAQDNLWGVGLRWTPATREDWTIDVGLTNGKGQTSSFSVAPGILDSSALYAAATRTAW